MKCKFCNTTEIIKINKPENVKFQCEENHIWFENYKDQAGTHERPETYELNLEDVLFPKEKKLYKKVLNDINKNQNFYTNSSPEEITSHLINDCNFNEEEIYKLFKKISKFSKS